MAGGSPRHVEGALAPEHRRVSDPASPPQSVLDEFIEEAKKVFGIPDNEPEEPRRGSYGFIDTTSNCSQNTYGYSSLYYKRKGAFNINRINIIREAFGGRRQGGKSFKEPEEDKNRKVYRVCEDCGNALYEGTYDVVSHLCVRKKSE